MAANGSNPQPVVNSEQSGGSWQPILDTGLTVNSENDGKDTDTDDDRCDSNPNEAGQQCTLRAAIQEANARDGADEIAFELDGAGVPSISPGSPLPRVTEPVELDGTTQPGAAQVRLVGSDAGKDAVGLFISGGDSTVRGMQIGDFDTAISLEDQGNNVIAGNVLGGDAANPSAAGLGTNRYGVVVLDSDNNLIGGSVAADANAIQAQVPDGSPVPKKLFNRGTGVLVREGSEGNQVKGNEVIGSFFAIAVYGATDTQVGGPGAEEGNAIANNAVGIIVPGTGKRPTGATTIEGNAIGGEPGAADFVPLAGVIVAGDVTGVRVGTPGSGNMIAGNAFGVMVDHASQISVEGNELRSFGLAPANGIGVAAFGARGLEVGSALGGNTISGSTVGVLADGGKDLHVAGNTISRADAGPAGGGIVVEDARGAGDNEIEIGGAAALGNHLSKLALGVQLIRSKNLSIEDGKVEDGALGVNITKSTDVNVAGVDLDSNRLGLSVNSGGLRDPRFPRTAYDAFFAEVEHFESQPEVDAARALADSFSRAKPIAREGKLSIDVEVTRSSIHDGGTGVLLSPRTENVSLGSNDDADANVITHNGDTGVAIPGPFEKADQVQILRNVIELNGFVTTVPGLVGLNVDVGDDLARTPLGTPELTRAEIVGGQVELDGALSARPSTEYSISIYRSDRCGANGQGEATTFVSELTERTDADGNAAFATSVPESTSLHYSAIATPTQAEQGSTGELSGCREAAPGARGFPE